MRFDYVKYDEQSIADQLKFKAEFEMLAAMAETFLPKGRHQALVLTKLEEAYMWVGKAIRDHQFTRMETVEPQESRGNS